MRVVSNFASRPSETLQENPKCFLIYEGKSTEPMYFEGLIANRKELKISESKELISVLRSIRKDGFSHPIHVFATAIEIIKQNEEERIKKESFLNIIEDFFTENNVEGYEELLEIITKYVNDNYEESISYDEINELFMNIYKINYSDYIVPDIKQYINEQIVNLDYNPAIDVINLIIDRDKQSFKDEKYMPFLKDCAENNLNLYVSNPCFELWLLMHFDEFDSFDEETFEKLLENKRISPKKHSKKFSSKLLSDVAKGYSKTNIDFEVYMPHIDEAIEREKHYCEDLNKLMNTVGTNVGLLIEDMRK